MPDPSRTIEEILKTIEIAINNQILINNKLADTHGPSYDICFKTVERGRKRKRNDMIQDKMLAEREAKIMKNLRKMEIRSNTVVFKGKPVIFRAKKKKLVKKNTNKVKQSQADLDYVRYVGRQ